MTRSAWTLAVAVLVPLVTAPSPARAQSQDREEILAFDVDIDVADGGSMTVTETLRVRALGQQIRRGIFRDLPTRFPREEGVGTIVAPLEVLAVRRDGNPEPYRIETAPGPGGRSGVRIRIGEADVLLEPGEHTYTITYRTERWMRFEEDRDHLAWNVTGNGWDFPIRRATARIALPGSVPREAVALQAWTGPEGSTEAEARAAYRPATGVAVFETTAALAPREGLTVEVGLPADVVAPPTPEQVRSWRWLDWGAYVEAAVACLAVMALYLLLWVRVGRDPDRVPVMVRYEPPAGFSPAALGYLQQRGFSTALLTASVVNLAVSGAIRLERDDDDTWTLTPTGVDPEGLAREERKLLHELHPGARSLTLRGSTNRRLRSGTATLRRHLGRALEGRYFHLNRRWFLGGALVSAAAFAVLAWRHRFDVPPEAWFLGLWLTVWTLGTATLVVRVVRGWWRVLTGDRSALAGALGATLFALPFVGAEIVVAGLLYRQAPGHLVAAALGIGALNVVFYHLLERPTLEGRGVLTRLEGFRRFLEGTEADRFDRLQDPEGALELFERYLPHAIALGVENRWADRFDAALARAGRVPEAGTSASFSPSWYGSTGGVASAGGLSRSLGSSFGSTLSSSSAAPSSSGSGGGSSGGSSGGGGGGGGGGGW